MSPSVKPLLARIALGLKLYPTLRRGLPPALQTVPIAFNMLIFISTMCKGDLMTISTQEGYQGEVDVYQESIQHIRGKKRARRAKGKKKKQKTSLMITNDDGTDSTTQV